MLKNKDNLKVYVDNCVLSQLIWHTIVDEQQTALEKICNYNCIDFVTSPVTLEEFNKTPSSSHQNSLKSIL